MITNNNIIYDYSKDYTDINLNNYLNDNQLNILNNTIVHVSALADTNLKNFAVKVLEAVKCPIKTSDYLKFLLKLKSFDYNEYHKILDCRSYDVRIVDGTHYASVSHRCHSKYCILCDISKNNNTKRVLKQLMKKQEGGNLPLRMLTLTWKDNSFISKDIHNKKSANVKALKTQLRRYGYEFVKGVRVWEITYHREGESKLSRKNKKNYGVYESNSFHIHTHMIYYGRYKPVKKYLKFQKYFSVDGYIDSNFLRELWRGITGDSHIVNLQRIKYGANGGVNYVCKYLTKCVDITKIQPSKLVEYDNYRCRLRLIEKFGIDDKISNYKAVCLCPICKIKMRYESEYMGGIIPLSIPLLYINKGEYDKLKN